VASQTCVNTRFYQYVDQVEGYSVNLRLIFIKFFQLHYQVRPFTGSSIHLHPGTSEQRRGDRIGEEAAEKFHPATHQGCARLAYILFMECIASRS